MNKIATVFVLSLLLAACGEKTDVSKIPSGIYGTFKIENGKDTFVFTKDGEVTSKHPLFPSKVTQYKTNNSEVTFQFNEGYPMKFKIIDDKILKSDSGETFIKQ